MPDDIQFVTKVEKVENKVFMLVLKPYLHKINLSKT